jgi:hypothetical protein
MMVLPESGTAMLLSGAGRCHRNLSESPLPRTQEITDTCWFRGGTHFMRHRNKLILLLTAGCIASAVIWYIAWNPGPAGTQRYDRRTNGIWIGHQWYTGKNVRTGAPVSAEERNVLVEKFNRYGIRDVFIHAGPIMADGTVDDMPGPYFDTLRILTPGIRYLPWLGGNARSLPLENRCWRSEFIQTLGMLRTAGFEGVHLDIEPLASFHPGYLDLLREIREAFGGKFVISHATRKLAFLDSRVPVAARFFWSAQFYRACMEKADQTVLMGYDTCIKFEKIYRVYMQFQTERLCAYADAVAGHRVMIGIPSYEDVPRLSDPRVENIHNAALGVRAALEQCTNGGESFDGVAIYACWTTDSSEWKAYDAYWMNR